MSLISEQVRRLREFAKTLKYADEYNLVNGAADTIEELSAKLHKSQMERSNQYYNGGWIPVSERLPEKNDVYQVAVNSWGCPTRDVDGFMAHTDRKWEVYGNKVIAWMPLPELHEPQESEE